MRMRILKTGHEKIAFAVDLTLKLRIAFLNGRSDVADTVVISPQLAFDQILILHCQDPGIIKTYRHVFFLSN